MAKDQLANREVIVVSVRRASIYRHRVFGIRGVRRSSCRSGVRPQEDHLAKGKPLAAGGKGRRNKSFKRKRRQNSEPIAVAAFLIIYKYICSKNLRNAAVS